jgi:hypothetical protein
MSTPPAATTHVCSCATPRRVLSRLVLREGRRIEDLDRVEAGETSLVAPSQDHGEVLGVPVRVEVARGVEVARREVGIVLAARIHFLEWWWGFASPADHRVGSVAFPIAAGPEDEPSDEQCGHDLLPAVRNPHGPGSSKPRTPRRPQGGKAPVHRGVAAARGRNRATARSGHKSAPVLHERRLSTPMDTGIIALSGGTP